MEELVSQHKKELKALDGEKRAAIKKAKTTKGKKAKDEVTNVEEEFASKLKIMEERHVSELATFKASGSDDSNIVSTTVDNKDTINNDQSNTDTVAIAAMERQKKLEKIRLQKENERQKILQAERDAKMELQNAGPTLRDTEIQSIQQQLLPIQYTIQPTMADGNCLYRAIAAQCPKIVDATNATTTMMTYQDIRALCAKTMLEHEDEFAPFCEYSDNDAATTSDDNNNTTITNFEQYVQSILDVSGKYWGGHLEIRAISMALHRPIYIYSSSTTVSNGPLIIDANNNDDSDHDNSNAEPIRLSYHLHYYALGEHYNQVVPITSTTNKGSE